MTPQFSLSRRFLTRVVAVVALVVAGHPNVVVAQSTGIVAGRITGAGGSAIGSAVVSTTGFQPVSTNDEGRYALVVPTGSHTITVRRIGYAPRDTTLIIAAGVRAVLDIALAPAAFTLDQVTVTTVSRQPERVVYAPAAVGSVDSARIREMAGTGQTPLLVADMPGVHVMQSGLYDFNLNARGFNGTLSRNVLVLVDGRDVSIPLGGNQDWADLSLLPNTARVEMVRGPGSALYGANAFSGVLAITTPAIRESHQDFLNMTGGELSSIRLSGSHSVLANDYRWGFRVNGGYASSSTWDVSRVTANYLNAEYADAGLSSKDIHTPAPGFETTPLFGQSVSHTAAGAPTGAVTGTPDPVRTYFGSARFDYYPADGSIVTVEGGDSQMENPVITQGAGRSQVTRATRPWARAAWTSSDFSLMTYYTGRNGRQVSLGTGTEGIDVDNTIHAEGQFNHNFAGDRGRFVLGGSLRAFSVDSKGTVLDAADDGRTDTFGALFGQADFEITKMLKALVATRYDQGTLTSAQFSPKVGLVLAPDADNVFRVTFNRGFRTPSQLERFLYFPAGAPLDLTQLEQGLRASPLGSALQGVPAGALFTQSSSVPLLAIGNTHLRPEQVTSWELGYKGEGKRLSFSADMFYDLIDDFTSGILTGVNSDYAPWTAPDAVPSSARAAVETAVHSAVGGLSRLKNGSTAYVLSYGNEGRATEWGSELGVGFAISQTLRADVNYSLYRSALRQATFNPADTILSNTPPNTVNAALVYHQANGARVRVGFRYDDRFQFRSGQWAGPVPASQTVDLTASTPIGTHWDVGVTGTNVFDEQRFHIYGGSIVGRRLLTTLTWKP
ncbi:MAG: TonB-dependent receptor [Gemmatimonadaceae bacterium]